MRIIAERRGHARRNDIIGFFVRVGIAPAALRADRLAPLPTLQRRDLGALPPPLATELGFTRVRSPLSGRSRINPTSAGGVGRGWNARVNLVACPLPVPPP